MSSASIVSDTGKTRLQVALERAKNGGPPAVGQWLEFPGYSLARTVASLGGVDVRLTKAEISPCFVHTADQCE